MWTRETFYSRQSENERLVKNCVVSRLGYFHSGVRASQCARRRFSVFASLPARAAEQTLIILFSFSFDEVLKVVVTYISNEIEFRLPVV